MNWKEMPAETAELEIEAEIEAEAFALIAAGYEPRTSQDKWRIVMDEQQTLRIYRTASGSCIYKAQFAAVDDIYTITHAWANRDPDQYRGQDVVYDARLFVFLLRKLLLQHDVPFPLPADLPHRNKEIHQKHFMGEDPHTPPSYIPLN